ncbi:MAG: outer membrane beta-barrel protein [Vicinamibacterales bacterium]
MSVRKLLGTAALVFVVAGAAPAKASADWLFTPFVGINWGGNAKFNESGASFDDKFERKVDFGASLAWMGAGVLGFEFDFGYSPNFFENTTGSSGANFGYDKSTVTTLMANVIVGAPVGGTSGKGIRPYASGGVGIIRTNIDDADAFFDISSSDLGYNVGGGAHFFFSDNVGLRGDVRYFRSLKDDSPDNDIDFSLGSFKFWRGTVGVSFRF